MKKLMKIFLWTLYFCGLSMTITAIIAYMRPIIYIDIIKFLGMNIRNKQLVLMCYNKVEFIAGLSPFFILPLPFLLKNLFSHKSSSKISKIANVYIFIIAIFFIVSLFYTASIQEIFIALHFPDFLAYDFLLLMQNCKLIFGVLSIIFFVCWGVYNFISYYIKRINQPTAETLLQKDQRKPILILRPFKIDKSRMPPVKLGTVGSFIQIENLLTYVLSSKGPVIAIGRPGEKIQPLGASRLYISGTSSWQEEVQELLDNSALIIIFLDYSPGVKWEIKQTIEHYRSKVIFVPSLYGFKINWIVYLFERIPNLGLLYTDGLKRLTFKHRKRFLHYRRGFGWYKKWYQLKSEIGILPDIDDKIGSFLFDDKDGVVIFESKNATLTEQVNSILHAIHFMN